MSRKTCICFFLSILLCISFASCGESVQPQNPDIATEFPDPTSDADMKTDEEPVLQDDERDDSDVQFDVVPQICNDIMGKLVSRGWNNVTVTHGSIETRPWGICVDTTYGAEDSHIYTIMGDSDKSVIKSDINIHAFSVVVYDDVLHDWVEEPIFYISDAGIVLNMHDWIQCLEIKKEYISYEYLDSTEYLYADEKFFTYWMYSY